MGGGTIVPPLPPHIRGGPPDPPASQKRIKKIKYSDTFGEGLGVWGLAPF